ncbi:MAG: type II secretion system protein [Synergistaceae bacterium]|nr:type II secretion system protein [Synergistaceae bacterium]
MIRKGFTLIELLIVIVVIGILTAMMYMSSSEAVTTANATRIVNDLRMLSTAAQHWYFDNERGLQYVGKDGYHFVIDGKEVKLHDALLANGYGVKKYISNQSFPLNTGKKDDYQNMYVAVGGYSVYLGFGNTVCYVVYRISGDNKMKDYARLREKLKGRRNAAKLVYYNYGKQTETPYNGENFVCIRVFALDTAKIKSK